MHIFNLHFVGHIVMSFLLAAGPRGVGRVRRGVQRPQQDTQVRRQPKGRQGAAEDEVKVRRRRWWLPWRRRLLRRPPACTGGRCPRKRRSGLGDSWPPFRSIIIIIQFDATR